MRVPCGPAGVWPPAPVTPSPSCHTACMRYTLHRRTVARAGTGRSISHRSHPLFNHLCSLQFLSASPLLARIRALQQSCSVREAHQSLAAYMASNSMPCHDCLSLQCCHVVTDAWRQWHQLHEGHLKNCVQYLMAKTLRDCSILINIDSCPLGGSTAFIPDQRWAFYS